MHYQSLYRQFRPLGFNDGYVGQQHIVQTLQNSLRDNRIGHAYLFSGPRGTGKTTTAKILAKAVNCQSSDKPVTEPCNKCQLCEQVNHGQAMDVLELDGATNRGIEEVRDLRERVRYAPAAGRFKVYIIDEVHMLTTEAFNALLKTLEEPPGHVIFILATTEPHKIPATILSRCQRYDFRPLSEEQIAQHLQTVAEKAGATVEEPAARLIAFRAQGGLRDALGLLEQVVSFSGSTVKESQVWEALGTVDRNRLAMFVNTLGQGDINTALSMIAQYSQMGVDLQHLLSDLLDFLRQCLVAAGSGSNDYDQVTANLNSGQIMAMMDLVAKEIQDSKYWLQPRLALEMLAVRVCRSFLQKPESPDKPQVREASVQSPGGSVAGRTPAKKAKPQRVSDEKWEEVLQLVKGESISTYAWLKEATSYTDGSQALFTYPEGYLLHRDNIVKGEHRQNIVPALKKVLGVDSYIVSDNDQ